MNAVRVALIGAGSIGEKHLATIRASSQGTLAAIADPDPKSEALAIKAGARWFANAEQMLNEIRPDGAVIATPNQMHATNGLACAARQVHMLVEKPLAHTLEAALDLTAAAERSGTRLLVGHHRRHNPIVLKAREIVQSGVLGRLTMITAECLLLKPEDYFVLDWRRAPGAGPVLTNLVHDLDSLRFICGEIVSIEALTSNAARNFATEDSAVVALRFASGALGALTVSDAAASPWSWELTAGENPFYPQQSQDCYRIAGTEGSLALPSLTHYLYGEPRGWGEPLLQQKHEVIHVDPFAEQFRHFCAVIRGDEIPRISGRDGARTLEATLAVQKAAAMGRAVTLAGQ